MSEVFAETLLRGDDQAAGRLAASDDDRSALAEKRALDGTGPRPPGPPRGELASYLRVRSCLITLDVAGLTGLASTAPPRIASLARAWAAQLGGHPATPTLVGAGSDPLSVALRVESLVLDAATALPGAAENEVSPRELGLLREAAALASGADQPHSQYLAYAALARARRRMGRVPMATRLLASLVRGAPRLYHPWLAWDARLVGLREARSPATDGLEQVLASARAGDGHAFARAGQALLSSTSVSTTMLGEARALLSALDPTLELDAVDPRAQAFVRGERSELAGALESAGLDPETPDAPVAYALIDSRGVRRVLAAGLPLAGPRARLEISEHGGRTETAIVSLAAHPAGLDEEVFFRAVYGFGFKKLLHDGVLRVLLTRMRQALEPFASLIREDTLRIVVREPFVVVDPRVSSRADNLVLRAIASERAVSAKELAERTGLPLRTVQAELARLLDEGVCKKSKDGRSTEYLVEDTVVREPSRVITARDLAP